MPLYEYVCADCGPFSAWTPMAAAAEACPCPNCRASGERQLAAPHLAMMHGGLRKAMERADRSAVEPKVASRKHVDSCGCSLCSTRKKAPGVERRWMVGH